MARKKKDREQGTFSRTLGGKILTTAVINQLSIGAHKDKVSFTSLSLTGEQNETITDMVKNERDVLITIGLEPPGDKQFPQIQVKGKLKGYKISKTCDSPDVVNIQFSSGQVEKLTNIIRSEEKIELTFTECEPELEFGDGDKDEDGDEREQVA